jgi:hypothetical protein
MLLAKTYLINSTKLHYTYLGSKYPYEMATILLKFEKNNGWDLRLDNIYVHHTAHILDCVYELI